MARSARAGAGSRLRVLRPCGPCGRCAHGRRCPCDARRRRSAGARRARARAEIEGPRHDAEDGDQGHPHARLQPVPERSHASIMDKRLSLRPSRDGRSRRPSSGARMQPPLLARPCDAAAPSPSRCASPLASPSATVPVPATSRSSIPSRRRAPGTTTGAAYFAALENGGKVADKLVAREHAGGGARRAAHDERRCARRDAHARDRRHRAGAEGEGADAARHGRCT